MSYPPLWNYVGAFWTETDQKASGRDICQNCRSLELKEMENTLAFELACEKWGLDTGDRANMRLGTYQPQNNSQKLALDAAWQMVTALKKRGKARHGIWLWSRGYGVGKTHLMVGILWEAANLNLGVAMYDEPSLLTEIKETYNGSGNELEIINKAREVDLFGFDDVGRGYVRAQSIEWYQEIVYKILNERWGTSKPMVLTTNFSPDELVVRLGGAAYSRLCGLCPVVIQLAGDDFRKRNGRNGK